MTYTGGPLNWLYGQSRVSNPNESIHVMNLVRAHDPDNPDELYECINRHYYDSCQCGGDGGGTLEDYGRWLYEAQADVWGEYRHTLDECEQWIYDLFVMQSLKGHGVESEARDVFGESFTVREPTAEADTEYRVDLILEYDDDVIAGVQVKPVSYKQMRESVKTRNDAAHAEIDEPVLYCFYDYDAEQFTNIESVLSECFELVRDD